MASQREGATPKEESPAACLALPDGSVPRQGPEGKSLCAWGGRS